MLKQNHHLSTAKSLPSAEETLERFHMKSQAAAAEESRLNPKPQETIERLKQAVAEEALEGLDLIPMLETLENLVLGAAEEPVERLNLKP